MDLVNDLSSDLALAVFVEGRLNRKLDAQDAKTFIAQVEAELSRISRELPRSESDRKIAVVSANLSH